jgi:REP element-mobilizing transposase RayT
MARLLRTYFPGGFFHVTARTHSRAEWFDQTMRDHVCDCIAIVQQRCDVSIRAFIVMTNHLHFVLQQGDQPLSRFMQPLLCRVALAVKKKYKIEGHIFERRYWSHPCMSVEYLRSCIEYVHRNPVKARYCTDPADYKWSSYSAYRGCPRLTPVVVDPLIEFQDCSSMSHARLPVKCIHTDRPGRDLGDIVTYVLRRFEPTINVDLLRNTRGVAAARVRRECIREASLAGYRNNQIAKYLKVSDSVVSKVVVQLRQNAVVAAAYLDRPKSEDETQVRKK